MPRPLSIRTLARLVGLFASLSSPLIGVAEDRSEHWAFKAPTRPSLPKVKDEAWPRNPVDRFVLSRLEAEGLKPSPEADRTTLIRRLSLDLIGLPPTPEEVDGFLADTSDRAYEKVVDRLLASPAALRRWGRAHSTRWLRGHGRVREGQDAVSSVSIETGSSGAFNRDLPYNQFIIEQIAKRLLAPGATQDQAVATGFLRNSMVNEEGGVDPEQFRMEAMFDRVEAIGKGVLGLTVQCAQCHNHKFDPISQAEYYKLFAFLNNDDEPTRVVYTPDERRMVADFRRGIREVEDGLRHSNPDWR